MTLLLAAPDPTLVRAPAVLAAVQIILLLMVAAGATAVVLSRNVTRQVILLSIYGVLLAVVFLVFQAPDVTLSELTVGAVVLPLLILLALGKTRATGPPDQPANSADTEGDRS